MTNKNTKKKLQKGAAVAGAVGAVSLGVAAASQDEKVVKQSRDDLSLNKSIDPEDLIQDSVNQIDDVKTTEHRIETTKQTSAVAGNHEENIMELSQQEPLLEALRSQINLLSTNIENI